MELYLLILLPVLASLVLYLLPAKAGNLLAALLHTALLATAAHLFWRVRFQGELVTTDKGEGFLGIVLSCDQTSAAFVLLAVFLFLCLFVYTNFSERIGKLYSFLMTVLESLVILIFISQDLFNIYVAIEIVAIVCSILIMLKRESRSIYDGLVYLLINITGMTFFLLGLGMLYRQTGQLGLGPASEAVRGLQKEQLMLPYAMMMTGTALKCALFPMHFWLPHAHGTPGAPSAVSAVLSGLYVKCGIYLFLRLREMFAPVILMDSLFLWLGIVSSRVGAAMAVCQKDVKLILAYHTVSQVGLIVAGLCSGTSYGYSGAMLHIYNHALFKSLLFLAAGILIKQYGTRNVYEIRGVMRSLPVVGAACAAGILGITGAPFFNGSISKYFLMKELDPAISACMILINFGTLLSFTKFGAMLFGAKRETHYRPDPFSGAVVALLGGLCLITGLWAEPFTHLILGTPFSVTLGGYIQKCLIWAVSLGAAFAAYRFVILKSKRIHAGIDMTLDFNRMAILLSMSFALIMGSVLIFA